MREASAYDTIITDENMPGMSGLQLLKAVKQVRPKTPVVLTSGHADQALIAEAFQGNTTKGVGGDEREPSESFLNLSQHETYLIQDSQIVATASPQLLDFVPQQVWHGC